MDGEEETEYLCGCKAAGALVSVRCPMHEKPEVHRAILLLESYLSDNGFTFIRHQFSQGLKVYWKTLNDDDGYFGKIFLNHDSNSTVQLHLPGRSHHPEFDLHDPDSLEAIASRLRNKSP